MAEYLMFVAVFLLLFSSAMFFMAAMH